MPTPHPHQPGDDPDYAEQRGRDAIARLETRGCCDDVRAENERLRQVVARVDAYAAWLETHNIGTSRVLATDLRAALADPAPVAPARHDDTQDGAR